MSTKNRLRMRKLGAVALVDRPDNPPAAVVLHKRAADAAPEPTPSVWQRIQKFVAEALKMDGGAMTFAETVEHREHMERMQALMDKVWALNDALYSIAADETLSEAGVRTKMRESLEQFAAAMDEGGADAAEKRATPEATVTGDGAMPEVTKPTEPQPTEDVAKGLPEDVQKRMEALEKRAQEAEQAVEAMRVEKRVAEFVAKAAAYTHLPVKPDEFGPILRKVRDGVALTDDEFGEVERALAAANEAARTAKLFEEAGSGNVGPTDAERQIEQAAAALVKADPALTPEQAWSEVIKRQPKLYETYLSEQRSRARSA